MKHLINESVVREYAINVTVLVGCCVCVCVMLKAVEVETEHNSCTLWIRSNYTYLLGNLDTKYSDLVSSRLMYSRGWGRGLCNSCRCLEKYNNMYTR